MYSSVLHQLLLFIATAQLDTSVMKENCSRTLFIVWGEFHNHVEAGPPFGPNITSIKLKRLKNNPSLGAEPETDDDNDDDDDGDGVVGVKFNE